MDIKSNEKIQMGKKCNANMNDDTIHIQMNVKMKLKIQCN